LNETSKVLKFFEQDKYTDAKKALLDAVIALQQAGEELTTPIIYNQGGKTIEYMALQGIRSNILRMSSQEAQEILEILSERYQ